MTLAEASAAAAATDPGAANDAIPRAYNFTADIIGRNIKAGRADKPVYIDPLGSWTYGQLAERVERFGRVLRSLGIRREERIMLALTDTIDWPTAFLGAIKSGIVPVPVNTLMTEDDYRFMLADSRAKVLVVSEALFPKFASLIGSSPDLVQVIVSGANARGYRRFEDLMAAARPDPYLPTTPTTRDDMCFWLYTSGSTGRPKGAVHTHANLRLTADLYAAGVLGLQGNRRLLFGGEAVLRLRPRQCADLPDGGRRHHGPAAGPAHARARRRAAALASGHGVLCGADVLRRAARQPERAGAQRTSSSGSRCRPARRCRPMSAAAGRSVTTSTSSTASARPRCCTSSSRTIPAR